MNNVRVLIITVKWTITKSDNLLNDCQCVLAEFLHLPEDHDILNPKKCVYSLMFSFLCHAVSWKWPKEEEAIEVTKRPNEIKIRIVTNHIIGTSHSAILKTYGQEATLSLFVTSSLWWPEYWATYNQVANGTPAVAGLFWNHS